MNALVKTFKVDSAPNPYQTTSSFAFVWGWRAAFNVTYAVEFLCLSAAKLMVLDRMSMFAAPEGTGIRRRWVKAGRIVMAVVVFGKYCTNMQQWNCTLRPNVDENEMRPRAYGIR